MQEWLSFLSESPPWWGLLLVFSAAALEYVFPPAPADVMVLAGALLVVGGALSFAAVLSAAVLGGLAGACVQYQLGRWWSPKLQRGGALPRWARGVDRFSAAFRRFGYLALLLNRAFPGVRSITFLAAGLAQMPFLPVLAVGLVSHAIWVGALLGVGVSVGRLDWENILAAFFVYRDAVFWTGGLGLALFLTLMLWSRSREQPIDSNDPD